MDVLNYISTYTPPIKNTFGFNLSEHILKIFKKYQKPIIGLGTAYQIYNECIDRVNNLYPTKESCIFPILSISLKSESDYYFDFNEIPEISVEQELYFLSLIDWKTIRATAEKYVFLQEKEFTENEKTVIKLLLFLRFLYNEFNNYSQEELAVAVLALLKEKTDTNILSPNEKQCAILFVEKCNQKIPEEYKYIRNYLAKLKCPEIKNLLTKNKEKIITKEKEFKSSSVQYVKSVLLGKGAYAQVYFAKHEGTKYAVKEYFNMSSFEGVNSDIIREIGFLSVLNHKNIIHLKDFQLKDNKLVLVLELLDTSLYSYMQKYSLNMRHIKKIMKNILEGISYLHQNNILHRDLKTDNILISKNLSSIKIIDFGLSIMLSNNKMMSNVYTTPYRAPNIFFKTPFKYGKEADMWAVGCIFGELIIDKIMFSEKNRNTDSEIQKRMFNFSGLPSKDIWDKYYTTHLTEQGEKIIENIKNVKKCELGNTDAEDLLSRFLDINPETRITAEDALLHRFFQE